MIAMILSLYISSFPVVFLRYFMYMDKLRIKKSTMYLWYGISFIFQGCLLIFLEQRTPLSFAEVQLYKIFINLPLLASSFFIIRENVSKQLTIYGISMFYNMMIMRVSNHLEYHLLRETIKAGSFFNRNIVNLILMGITLPFVAIFFRRVLLPALWKANDKVWNYIWLIPGMYTLLYFVYLLDISEESIASSRSLFMSIIVFIGIISAILLLLHAIRQMEDNARLKADMDTTNLILNQQREQYRSLTENIEHTKNMRHDMRHQIAAISGYLNRADLDGALRYCQELTQSIQSPDEKIFCDNLTINVIISYYLASAEGNGIKNFIKLQIPSDIGRISEQDLCVIFGNLLENAVEACQYVPESERFLHLSSRVRYNKLYITLDNSFDGNAKKENDIYLSRKRDGQGIGLSSIRAAAERYDGIVEFSFEGNVFQSSVMVDMGTKLTPPPHHP